ncbi:AMP-binding protein [Cyanobium sp. FGCU-52]|nr:AMP-binding protein [Cyanobium sp. FGCU52]
MSVWLAEAEGEAALRAAGIERVWAQGGCVALAGPGERQRLADELAAAGALDPGPSVLLGSGGSSGARRWCLQPLAHLEAAARATGAWLEGLGLDPASCLHLNPLPLHHVSGLLPLVRCRLWGAELHWLAPETLRDPRRLAASCPLPKGRPVLLSLVPTQLLRLLEDPAGIGWLAGCRLIWVGGAALPPDLAAWARAAVLPLAPCYGATETAAMVCVQTPERFLAGEPGCGLPLADVRLRLDPGSGAVEVATPRLSPGFLHHGRLEPLPLTTDGWWRSGDAGVLEDAGLQIRGRLDGAILSGGETVFPEQLEARLLAQAGDAGLPLEALLLLAEADPEWGQRLVALVRPRPDADPDQLMAALCSQVVGWPPAERPWRWRICPTLAPTAAGKWRRGHWQEWLRAHRVPPGPGG